MKKTATSVLDAWKSDEQAVFIIKKMNDDIAMMKRVQRMGIPKMNAKCLLLSLQLFKSTEDNENEDTLKLIALDEVGSKVNDENITPMYRTFGRLLNVTVSDLNVCSITCLLRSQILSVGEDSIEADLLIRFVHTHTHIYLNRQTGPLV